jgi:uncharacterized membrane protein
MVPPAMLVGALSLIHACFPIAEARADFKVCNRTAHTAVLAIGLQKRSSWVSEGWWRVKPQKCRTLVQGPLKARYYYLLAVHEGVDGYWEGSRPFCVSSKNFSVKGRENCRKRGYERIGFFEVDTANKLTWVQNLSD